MNSFLSQMIGLKRVKAQQADGTSAVTSDAVDLQAENADGVLFLTSFQTPAANNLAKLQESDDGSSWSDVANGAVAPGASDEVQFAEYVSPAKRYARLHCARGTSTVLGDIYAFPFRLREQPYDNTITGTIAGVTVK